MVPKIKEIDLNLFISLKILKITFPPSSSWTFLTPLAQFASIILPTAVEPVKLTFLTAGCSQIALPTYCLIILNYYWLKISKKLKILPIGVFFFDVVTTLMQPDGKPAISAN